MHNKFQLRRVFAFAVIAKFPKNHRALPRLTIIGIASQAIALRTREYRDSKQCPERVLEYLFSTLMSWVLTLNGAYDRVNTEITIAANFTSRNGLNDDKERNPSNQMTKYISTKSVNISLINILTYLRAHAVGSQQEYSICRSHIEIDVLEVQ